MEHVTKKLDNLDDIRSELMLLK